MAHPFNEHRQHKVEHSRVGHITKGYASGGAVHSDAKQDRKLFKKLMAEEDAQEVEGGEAKERMDRPGRAGKKAGGPVNRARGGRAKHKGHTTVNVITGGGHPTAPLAAGPPPGGIPGMGASPMLPPRPPMLPPGLPPGGPGMAPPGLGGPPGMMPPGMPPRSSGGRAYAKGGGVKNRADGGPTPLDPERPMTNREVIQARNRRLMSNANPFTRAAQLGKELPQALKEAGAAARESGSVREPMKLIGEKRGGGVSRARGGGVKSGPAWEEGKKAGTPVQNNPSGKNDQRDVGRGKPITYKTGGAVEAPMGSKPLTPHLPGGSGGGEARLAKEKLAKRGHGMAP